ncbi:hypothetical protein AC1031_011609 [Aphanomyces cochlioides]|nr:hypothetical protein AC1031_011609 [Aphanomyces cochlioides]
MTSVAALVEALAQDLTAPSLGRLFEQQAKACVDPSVRSAYSSTDVSIFVSFLSSQWKLILENGPTILSSTENGNDGEDDDGLSYTYTSTSTDVPDAPKTTFRNAAVMTLHIDALLSSYRFFRNVCVATPATQTKFLVLLQPTLDIIPIVIGWLDTSDQAIASQLALTVQVMLQFLGNMVVAHVDNQDIVWRRFHPALLEKILVECHQHRKMIAYAAAIIVNCLNPPQASRTGELVASRQIVILLLQRCLTPTTPVDEAAASDPAFEWITMVFQLLLQRHCTAALYQNLSVALLSSLWSKLTPEQMLLLRMVDMILTDDKKMPESMQDTALVDFFCGEFCALHSDNTSAASAAAGDDEVDLKLDPAPSEDRQAVWKVMELESSKLILDILGALTSQQVSKTSEATEKFVKTLSHQLQVHATTHSRSTNAFNPSEMDDIPQDASFGYRSAGIRALGNLVHRNKQIQDTVRLSGGLEVLLNSCNIDPRNPMIREWALVALRHVCEDNEANQAYIRALSPQEVVPRMDLSNMNVEPVLEGDKVHLKPKANP